MHCSVLETGCFYGSGFLIRFARPPGCTRTGDAGSPTFGHLVQFQPQRGEEATCIYACPGVPGNPDEFRAILYLPSHSARNPASSLMRANGIGSGFRTGSARFYLLFSAPSNLRRGAGVCGRGPTKSGAGRAPFFGYLLACRLTVSRLFVSIPALISRGKNFPDCDESLPAGWPTVSSRLFCLAFVSSLGPLRSL